MKVETVGELRRVMAELPDTAKLGLWVCDPNEILPDRASFDLVGISVRTALGERFLEIEVDVTDLRECMECGEYISHADEEHACEGPCGDFHEKCVVDHAAVCEHCRKDFIAQGLL